MSLSWTPAVAAALRPWAEGCYPFEGCGVLVGTDDGRGGRRAVRFVPLGNVLRSRERAAAGVLETAAQTLGARAESQGQFEFVMDPAEFNRAALDAARDGLDVVGVLHTHPDHPARPSATDAAQPFLAGWSNVIVKVDQGRFVEARSWFRAEESAPFAEEPIEEK
ncbi:MAG: M67 family metallopeptidase [Elusimicrobia bacterium]|nr:M67 family metallopeptidase [Elusimicrobiota bacterium]MBK7208378.1 M67 family metallopeptidase [Elusimicrobiota bacterium]MBK7545138.1 M67 family metallopeptidase [Elusimicrobiota bacterium]MBK7574659.1 M67 family metallopeptidase [Elusimicrobiota bacterium]MBK7688768.1 M67 family metallopeptidase [Elusimicrobiota bacterium]